MNFHVLSLPPELISHMLSYLDVCSIAKVSATCSTFNLFANDDVLWKGLYYRDFPNVLETSDGSWKEQYRRQHIIARYRRKEERRLKLLGLELTRLEDGYLDGY